MRLTASAALLLTLAIPVTAAAQKQTETVDRTIAIGDRGRLELKNFSGDVRISGTAGTEAIIHAVRRGTRERLDGIQLAIETDGSTVKIEANKRTREWRDKDDNVVETEFDIQVPRGTQLDLYAFSGKIEVKGMTGGIEAETFSGNIQIDVADATDVPALDIETFSGDIQARVPASASGKVRFSSFSGGVQSDVPISMSSRSNGWNSPVNGEIGTGSGPTLRFKTFSGDLRIQK